MFGRWSDTFDTLLALQKALESTRTSDWLGGATSSYGAFPPVNVFQQGEDFLVIAELPGVSKEDLDIQVKNQEVRVSGSKKVAYAEGMSVHRRERVSGEFDRTLTFPARIEADGAKAEYRDGILALFLPRAESERARSVQVA